MVSAWRVRAHDTTLDRSHVRDVIWICRRGPGLGGPAQPTAFTFSRVPEPFMLSYSQEQRSRTDRTVESVVGIPIEIRVYLQY